MAAYEAVVGRRLSPQRVLLYNAVTVHAPTSPIASASPRRRSVVGGHSLRTWRGRGQRHNGCTLLWPKQWARTGGDREKRTLFPSAHRWR